MRHWICDAFVLWKKVNIAYVDVTSILCAGERRTKHHEGVFSTQKREHIRCGGIQKIPIPA